MGLDMYLVGEESVILNNDDEGIELGYWRKHPNLHGYIVNTFAGGEDDCQKIYLTANDIVDIIRAVRGKRLPETSGFFFGKSTEEFSPSAKDIENFTKAITWLSEDEGRKVYYQASW